MKKFTKVYDDYDQIFLAAGLGYFLGSFNLIDMFKHEDFNVERVSCPQ